MSKHQSGLKLLTRQLFIISVLFTGSYSFAASAPSAFDNGVTAFEKKDFQLALQYFKEAEAGGMKTSGLRHNLGVCYYQLQNYPEAEKQFKLAARDTKMAQLAYYNLGRTAQRMGKTDEAVAWYGKTVNLPTDAKLVTLARHQLLQIENTPRKPSLSAGALVALGHDDNVTLVATESPSHQSDEYLEALVYLNAPLTEHLYINATAYKLDYRNVNSADFGQLTADIGYEMKVDAWRIMPEIGVAKSNLGGSGYQSIIDTKLTGKRKFTNSRSLLLRIRYSDISSDNTVYNYLEGTRWQWRAEYKQPSELGDLRLRYELETNNRQNSLTENYSPTRHELRARVEQSTGGFWHFQEELQYRLSQYGEAAGVSRKDTRTMLNLQASREFSKNISIGGKFSRTNNDSNVAADAYNRNDYQLFVDFTF